ncbi:symmetrical bis(5'-nucleosyl)-tetraphosphatase [Litoribrevibacter albus]|uniref:Bis(5'-nucleosyl)-tetraphosphatase, symmetrical n=1 Tax=Litoribrevibacter albus TaxID=1473156 RepID=A0AA37W857_9GAMM|nr:symmetrical bis(5'-nucleosyl)-tetraphosphatase [Litoribrevibacter albus]GLQ33387.1 bis(5'-nucleosyl)-tetraphosphatase, symmetrical [Litoribrevibacter albus]
MSTYAIGDIQGCYDELQQLLELVQFDPTQDTLWLAGDLVNRGPKSLETLRFVKALGQSAITVLGNHDLHLLACAHGIKKAKGSLVDILEADDRDELLDWLCQQPLVHHDSELGYTLVHAGIPPIWSVKKAIALSQEVEQALKSEHRQAYFEHMYGDLPDTWSDELKGLDRLRVITNYFTRMRFCDENGKLELKTKETADDWPEGYQPWFTFKSKKLKKERIIFGHWAALEGNTQSKHVFGLDTGCVWGGALTALRLEDQQRFSLPCLAHKRI